MAARRGNAPIPGRRQVASWRCSPRLANGTLATPVSVRETLVPRSLRLPLPPALTRPVPGFPPSSRPRGRPTRPLWFWWERWQASRAGSRHCRIKSTLRSSYGTSARSQLFMSRHGSPVACQRLGQAHASFTPDTARTATRQPPDPQRPSHRARFHPGNNALRRFDVIVRRFDASTVVYSRTSSRRTPDPSHRGLFRKRRRVARRNCPSPLPSNRT